MPDSTDPIRVLVTVTLTEEQQHAIRDVSPRIELLYYPEQRVSDIPDDIWRDTNVLLTYNTIPDPSQAPHLRWVQGHSAGVDHIIEQPLFQGEDVLLTSSSGIHTTNITEYIFMMMLAFGHRLPTMFRYQRDSSWATHEQRAEFLPLELRSSTIGIVGYGSIGRETAHIAHTFGMEVLAVKRDVRQPAETNEYVLPGTGDADGTFFHRLYPPEALASMVRECDFVVITLPLTDSTRNIFDADVIKAMKPTAFLINVGRGGIVDEHALLDALQHNRIGGYASDVFEAEPLPEDSPFWQMPNVIISPHISGTTSDYIQKLVALFTTNLTRYVARKDLLNVVDRTRGY